MRLNRRLTNHNLALGVLFAIVALLSACTHAGKSEADKCNNIAYAYHYRNLDSTLFYAQKAFDLSKGRYKEGMAEAYNNLAFVAIIRMQYDKAFSLLDSAASVSDSEIEQLVADVQHMRLCQRQSQNKDFYTFREKARLRIDRINEEYDLLDERLRKRVLYAATEFHIVNSTYYYYVGLEEKSINALAEINDESELQKDTAQWLSYLYNVGAGGIITQGSRDEINQVEIDYLLRCQVLARMADMPFWEANSLQAISEHLQDPEVRDRLIADNLPVIKSINTDNMPDSLLAGNLAQRSLDIFEQYGDVYQTAGSYRTLAQCYWLINDYPSSLFCLNEALTKDTAINQAPDLVASIREQLSVVYSALDDKTNSDLNRNIYLDLQEQTRQDRYLESRAESLNRSLKQLNVMISLIILLIIVAAVLALLLWYRRKKEDVDEQLSDLLKPLEQWQKNNAQIIESQNDLHEEIVEKQQITALHLANNKRRNLEQRAKTALVYQITPFIDRMLHEIKRLSANNEDQSIREERYAYISELADQINDYNAMLTEWIQLRQGELNLHIESFPLQPLFDLVEHSKTGFQLKGVALQVDPTGLWVKADRILTLFMINTIADNARKFTPKGGCVRIYAVEKENYVEINVADNGVGMNEEQILSAFSVEKKAFNDETVSADNYQPVKDKGHGFGLVNCKGIIEKYKKISSLFNNCTIDVESEVGKGSRFFFQLPKGVVKTLLILCLTASSFSAWGRGYGKPDANPAIKCTYIQAVSNKWTQDAERWADSAYYSNTRQEFNKTLDFADSARACLNAFYHELCPKGMDYMQKENDNAVALPEIVWYNDSLPFDYDVILDIRNESAVAALALHKWSLYRYNNKVYTQLFKEKSADKSLGNYCRRMQKSQTDKWVAIILLISLFVSLAFAYFFYFYRHHVYGRFCMERVKDMNDILLSDRSEEEKLKMINEKTANMGMADLKYSAQYNDKYMAGLRKVVGKMTDALKHSLQIKQKNAGEIEMAEDELKKGNYENDKFYVCNNVLDNCLSTLKHETMYYPSRIKALVAGGDKNINLISEMASFYHELYMLLTIQTSRQTESVKFNCSPVNVGNVLSKFTDTKVPDIFVAADEEMIVFLFDLIKKANGKERFSVVEWKDKSKYIALTVTLNNLELGSRSCDDLFTPSMDNIPFLLCRQIARESGERANARGCGIVAQYDDKHHVALTVTLPKWKQRI